jgi:RNA recognition motif. (a.k.a. RRM, RBD, or RNP domain)
VLRHVKEEGNVNGRTDKEEEGEGALLVPFGPARPWSNTSEVRVEVPVHRKSRSELTVALDCTIRCAVPEAPALSNVVKVALYDAMCIETDEATTTTTTDTPAAAFPGNSPGSCVCASQHYSIIPMYSSSSLPSSSPQGGASGGGGGGGGNSLFGNSNAPQGYGQPPPQQQPSRFGGGAAAAASGAGSGLDQGKIFVGGLSWQTTEESLMFHFQQYGPVTSVELMKDRLTGKPRGFGFVCFADPATVDLVMQEQHEVCHKVRYGRKSKKESEGYFSRRSKSKD